MNKRQKNFYDMYMVVLALLEDRMVELLTYPKFLDKYNELVAFRDPIETAAVGKYQGVAGATNQKKEYREAFEKSLVTLSGKLHALGQDVNDDKLKVDVRYTLWPLKKMPADKLEGVYIRLRDLADTRMLALADYSIDAPWMANLAAEAQLFRDYIVNPKLAISLRKEAGKEYDALIKDAGLFLRTKFHEMMQHFRYTNAALYKLYDNGRKQEKVRVEKPALTGTIKTADGTPLKGAVIKVKSNPRRKSISTTLGKFKFIRLPDGVYTLLVFIDGKLVMEVVGKTGEGVEVIINNE